MPEIVLTHVTKRWDKFYAVDDLNLAPDISISFMFSALSTSKWTRSAKPRKSATTGRQLWVM